METHEIKKSDIDDFSKLKQYLIGQANAGTRLHHYSTYESLLSIIEGKSFRLSRLDLLNYKAERKIGYHYDMVNSYVISFTKAKESVSMWAMGKASGIKLRLSFNSKLFKECINNLYYDSQKTKPILLKTKHLIKLKTDLFDSIQLSDVAYLDKDTNKLRHSGGPINKLVVNDKLVNRMTGFIKYDAWEFEKETRLRVQLNNIQYYKEDNEKDNLPKYIYCGITEDLIKSFQITFNPWMGDLLKKEIQKSLESKTGFKIICKNSAHDGEISEL